MLATPSICFNFRENSSVNAASSGAGTSPRPPTSSLITKSPVIKLFKYLLTLNEEITVKMTLNKMMLNDKEASMSSSFLLDRNKLAKAIRESLAPYDERFSFRPRLRFSFPAIPENFTASTGEIRDAVRPGLLAAIRTVR
ncbi:hypothetical protein D3C74_244850 [compost metagenome]